MEMLLAIFLFGGCFGIAIFILSILDKNLEKKIQRERAKKNQSDK